MNVLMRSCNMKRVHVRPFIKSESWPVVGFCPHVASIAVLAINLNTLCPIFWSSKEVFSAVNKATGLYSFITLT